jgi:lactate permease
MFLYTMTVVTGKFEIVKESIVHISFDRRLQCVLIAFSFGAIIEGTSGSARRSRSPGASWSGSAFGPSSPRAEPARQHRPVAWGAIGTPIVTLAAVSGLDQLTLSAMAGASCRSSRSSCRSGWSRRS